MIALARVDDRLVHGQITAGWAPHLQASRVIVANDRIAADQFLAGIVAAGGAGLRIEVLGVEEAARSSSAGTWEGEKVIVLFESLQDARRALDGGLFFEELNLGGLRHDGGTVCLCEGITLDREDCAIIGELRRRGVAIDVRLMPLESARDLPETLG